MNISQHVVIPPPSNGAGATLDILVDSFGHVGYGQAMYDFKGIVGAVTLNGEPLHEWQAHALPLDPTYLNGIQPIRDHANLRPGVFFKAFLHLDKTGDCYLDMSLWDKGYVWVNGNLLGRYWKVGPQLRLYCPMGFLRAGQNEIMVFDQHRTTATTIGCSEHLQF